MMLKQRRFKQKQGLLSSDEEIDPMIYSVNMVDCMLVLAVGFLIFTIMFMSTPTNVSSQEKAAMQQAVDLNMGQEVNSTVQNSSSGQSGLSSVGTVYKDPKTGKLIMIKNS